MKLIDIIYNVILEQVSDDEREDREREDFIDSDEVEDFEREIERDIEDIERDDIEFERDIEDREREEREERRPRIGNWACIDPVEYPGCKQIRDDNDVEIVVRFGFPFYREQEWCIESSPCMGEEERSPTTTTRPTTTTTTTRPVVLKRDVSVSSDGKTKTDGQSNTPTTTSPETTTSDGNLTPEMTVKTKYSSDEEIKDIGTIQSKKYIEKVKINLKKQLEIQTPQIQQKYKQYNIQPENISYLIPLSIQTGTLLATMEMEGLNLPLMMILYKNTDKLYEAMRENKPFTESEAKPVTGLIKYNNFWDWTNQVYKDWGPWIKTNVVSNFPEISKNTFPALAF